MPLIEPGRARALELIADHCLAAHAAITERGTPTMARLIDLLLFEVGRAIADEDDATDRGNGRERAADRRP